MTEQSEARTDGRVPGRRESATGATFSGGERPPTNDSTAGEASAGGAAGFAYAPGAPVAGNPVLFEADVPSSEIDVPANGIDARSSGIDAPPSGTDTASSGTDARYEWAFGDGATATGENASHVYDSAGEHPVSLTVTSAGGATRTVRRSVTVYHEVAVDVDDPDDGFLTVTLWGRDGFDPADAVAVESLRVGAPAALAMGGGASPVRSESREGDLRVRVRADETGLVDDRGFDSDSGHNPGSDRLDDRGLDRLDADATVRLVGRTTDGVPIAGTADSA